MTLHLEQIFLTDARTFKTSPSFRPIRNPTTAQVIGGQLHRDFITRKNLNVMLAHLARNMGNNLMVVFERYTEHGIWQSLLHGPVNLNRFASGQISLFTQLP